jgi:hypothetical protein
MVFAKGEHGWQAMWLPLYLFGRPSFKRVEDNTFTMADRVRALMHRRYLTVSYLVDLWRAGTEVSTCEGRLPDEQVTFLGVEAPRVRRPLHTYPLAGRRWTRSQLPKPSILGRATGSVGPAR